MGKRGRPRKNPPQKPRNISDDEESIIKEGLVGENPTEISPQEELLTDTAQEEPSKVVPEDAPNALEIPAEWSDIAIIDLAKQGWTYRKRIDDDGRAYMYIRNRTNERSLGRWSREREKLLFELYPILYKPQKVETETPAEPQDDGSKGLGKRPFFNVPIKRIAVIPGDYRPTLDTIRCFHVYKNNGFPGDFSDFMNGIIRTHFMKCHGITFPLYINEELIQKNA